MNSNPDETSSLPAEPASGIAGSAAEDQPAAETPATGPGRLQSVQPTLEKLFELYPHLFGAEFLPLKLGIFQELLARHPDEFKRETLKAALGVHTRSTRYLQSVAAGKKRHDLDGAALDAVAPEHVYLSLLELFRRRQSRSKEDLRPKFRAQLIAAFEASGMSRQDYLARVQNNDAEATRLLEEALAEHGEKAAKADALVRAFENSGKTAQEFADMYGLNAKEVLAADGVKTPGRQPTYTQGDTACGCNARLPASQGLSSPRCRASRALQCSRRKSLRHPGRPPRLVRRCLPGADAASRTVSGWCSC